MIGTISTVFVPNVIAIALLLLLLFSISSVSRHRMLMDSKIFALMILCNFYQSAVEIATYAIDGKMIVGFHGLSLFLNSSLFIVNIFFAFLWVIYSDYKIFEDAQHTRKYAKIMVIPALIVTIGIIINLFVPIFFKVTDTNEYQRATYFILPYVLTYAYLLHGTIYIYINKSKARKYVFMPAILFMVPIIVGSVIQFCFYGVSTTWIGVAIALVAVYINMQNEVSYTDVLSGLYTRIYMYQYLESALRRGNNGKKIAGIMLDIDSFKKINDTLGHLTGDDAIRTVGKILHQILPAGSIAARYGGDEFVVLQEVYSENAIIETLNMIKQAEDDFEMNGDKEYSLRFSKGYAILDPAVDSVDTFLERMDRAMYEDKNS